jgi:hypothetical protein
LVMFCMLLRTYCNLWQKQLFLWFVWKRLTFVNRLSH